MMERVDQSNQEEFIWVMRTKMMAATQDEGGNWRERKSSLFSYVMTAAADDAARKDADSVNQTKIIASLVPNEVIDFPEEFDHRDYDAVILLCHVSGYNTHYDYEKITKDDMTDIQDYMNSTLGYIMKTFLMNDGDVINFSNDTFFVIWKTMYLKDRAPCVTNALKATFTILQHFKSPKITVADNVAVKLAISFGGVTFTLIGSDDRPSYIVIGEPMTDAKNALDIAEYGEIIVSSTAWDLIVPEPYNFDRFSENYIKVYGVSQSYRASMDAKIRSGLRSYAQKHRPMVMDYGDTGILKEEFELRQELFAAVNLQMKPQLRRFIIEPVLEYIEQRESIEGLNETRHLVNVVVVCDTIPSYNSYDTVSRIAFLYDQIQFITDDHKGCIIDVYKLSNALTITLAFGLRGLTHKMECRLGLKCGQRIWNTFREFQSYLNCVTVAVTSGKSFCGMVGHPQRRQYVAIGKHNKLANRLAHVFKNQIVCDRETFLRSGYGTQNFVFQSDHPIRNMKNIGPIYTFEKDRKSVTSHALLKYPILDRSEEMNTYLNMLEHKKRYWNQKEASRSVWMSLVILGPSRAGRTRLADEYFFVNTGVKRYRVRLKSSDKNVPYQAVYQLFMKPLGITEHSSRSDREAKLLYFMRRLKSKDLLFWAMNVVFKVNFPIDDIFSSLDDHERTDALIAVLKELCRACFNELWTIILDGGEFIDNESWLLLHAINDTRLVFLIITVCSNVSLSSNAEIFLSSSSVRILHLKPVAKWYCIGLACQFLGVIAIPQQLENVLQKNSDGNPGWIECYLTSLMQENCISLKEADPNEHRSDLVYVPLDMLHRKRKLIFESGDFNEDETDNVKYYLMLREKWKMYRESHLKESATNLNDDDNSQYVCLLNFEPPDCSANSPEAFAVQIFDSLNSYEQMVLKCCSLIGDDIPRVMLAHIITRYNEVFFAKAIQKFFELKVLGCLEGHFVGHSGSAIIRPHKNVRFEHHENLTCRCIGLDIPNSCSQFPKYAMCGYMYFRVETFRQIAYRYLIASERKLYHNKAMSYLEMFTMRCMKCGGGSFKSDPDAVECRPRSRTRKTIVLHLRATKSDVSCTPIAAKNKFVDPAKSRSELDVIQVFNRSEYDSCECSLILSCMYTQLTHHYLALGMTYKWLLAMLEYSIVSIELSNIPLALKILNSALDVIVTGNPTSCRQHESEVWQTDHIHAKILMLIGKSRLELRQYKQAFQMLKKSLKLYDCSYSWRMKFIDVQEHMLLSFKSVLCLKTTKHQYIADYFDSVSECFSLMCKLFMHLDMWKKAEIAAVSSLKHALKSNQNFPMLLTAYCNTMAILLHNNKISLIKNIERRAVECYSSWTVVNYMEMKAILFLYRNQFFFRILMNELEKAIKLGPTILQLNQGLMGISNYDYDVNAMLFYCLLLRRKISGAFEVLVNLRMRAQAVSDYRGNVWYHTLCLVMQLETGYSVVTYRNCVQVFENNLRILSTNASKQLLVCLWLWCERLGYSEDGAKWKQKLDVLWSLNKSEPMLNILSGLYYAEALIINLVAARNVKDIKLMASKRAEIKSTLSKLFQNVVHLKCYLPRLYLLQSYFCYVQCLEGEGNALLRRALKTAKLHGNLFDCGFIKHTAKAWSGEMSMTEQYFWTDHAEHEQIHVAEFDEDTMNLGYYTFRLPGFVAAYP